MPKRGPTTPPVKRRSHLEILHITANSGHSTSSEGLVTDHGGPRPVSPFRTNRRSRFSSVPLVDIRTGESEKEETHQIWPASAELPRRHLYSPFFADSDSESSSHSGGGLCSMSDALESSCKTGGSGSPSAQASVRIKHVTRNSESPSRFPKLDECAHFHYDNVELGPINVSLCDDQPIRWGAPPSGESANCSPSASSFHSSQGSSGEQQLQHQSSAWFWVRISTQGRTWELRRSWDNFLMLDRQLHRCVYERKYSKLKDLSCLQIPPTDHEDGDGQGGDVALRTMLTEYLTRFSQLAGSLINCGPVLNWLELDNRGHRLIVTDEAAINTPAVAAAYVVRRYPAQAPDEIHLEVGDIISVIDMPPADESTWWRGKKGFQVGFFPCECVEIIGDKIPQTIKIPKSSAKPVLRKHGKLIAFFRQFLLSRPSRRKLKQSGILRERVFGCDLGEHLMNSGRDIPLVLKCCAEFIEEHGIVDGIYRLSGVTSNIQKLRLAFDEDRVPNLTDEAILQDIHCVGSLLKMYFRELPNPLLTFHLYDKFVSAVQSDESTRLLRLRDVVQQLPPPHYRSLEYLMRHLSKVADYGCQTGMTPKNVAIVWAPNLLRSREIENGGVGALHVVGVQAVLTECLIRYTDIIFSDKMPNFPTTPPLLPGEETPGKSRPKSLAISTPTKLLSLEEARSRALASNLPTAQPKFIDVGGGAENLPTKYHTVIELPGRRSGGKGKKSPSGWKSFFARGWHTASGRSKNRRNLRRFGGNPPKISGPIFPCHNDPLSSHGKAITESDVFHANAKKLRTVKSVESLLLLTSSSDLQSHHLDLCDPYSPMDENTISSQPASMEYTDLTTETASSVPVKSASDFQKHSRSVSHDSYFEHGLVFSSQQAQDIETIKDANLKISVLENQILSSPHKIAQKQKLISSETEASSPKLPKLSLKRFSAILSSPSTKRKNEAELLKQCEINSKQTDFVDDSIECENSCKSELEERSISAPRVTFQVENTSPNSNSCKTPLKLDSENADTDNDLDDDSLMQKTTSDFKEANMSMEATISDTISLSQLMSFESKNDPFSLHEEVEGNTPDAFRSSRLDSSLATPDSPTMDNVSDMPSSTGSEGSPPQEGKSTTDDIMQRMSASWPPDEFNFKEMTDNNKPAAQKKLFDETKNSEFQSSTNGHNVFDHETNDSPMDCKSSLDDSKEKLTESPLLNNPFKATGSVQSSPENFTVGIFKSSSETKSRGIEVKEMCPRFVSGVTISGSFDSTFREVDSSWCNIKKPKGIVLSDKSSPVSPIEESRRRFESEIGRLIVRDRQVRSEMERMKAERQKISEPKIEKIRKEPAVVKHDNMTNDHGGVVKKSPVIKKTFQEELNKSNDHGEIVKKSPVKKTFHEDLDKSFKTPPKEQDEKSKLSDWVLTSAYPQYLRMEKKPSVKELLSKFESQPKSEGNISNLKDLEQSPKAKVGSIFNIQVDHVSTRESPLQNSQPRTNYNHIFQTECVVRFPHPKSSPSSSTSNNVDEPKKTILGSPGSFLNSYLRSRNESNGSQTSATSTSLVSLLGTSFDSILGNNQGQNLTDKFCDALNLRRPSDVRNSPPAKTDSAAFQTTKMDECRPSVKLKSQFFGSDFSQTDSLKTSQDESSNTAPRRQRQSSAPTNRPPRPRSVPPPLMRLSVAPSSSSGSSEKVPKNNSKEVVNHRADPPRQIRERAAVFERSVSFSGCVDRKPPVIKR